MQRFSILLLAMMCLSGCGEDFYRTQQAWMAYRYSPAYYERTYYSDAHTPAGSAYCTTTCGLSRCVTHCDTYPK